jgi:hypothetical protein
MESILGGGDFDIVEEVDSEPTEVTLHKNQIKLWQIRIY